MRTFAALYLFSVPVFFAIDMLWLGVIAQPFYRGQLGHLMGPINWPVAVAFYFIFLVGLTIFATGPAFELRSLGHAILYGGLFGFFAYATYDLTNWATLRDWPAIVVFVDIIWGTVLSASVAAGAYLLGTTFLR